MSETAATAQFSADDERALASVLDEIIPPGGARKLPGAGELGLATFVAEFAQTMPVLQPVIEQGLATLTRLAASRDSRGFASLSATDRAAVLSELAAADQMFLPTLTFVAYVGYYQNPRIVTALGLEPRAPHPKGYEMEPNDLSLLEPVRRRGKIYREVK
jgi:hypothetical protein